MITFSVVIPVYNKDRYIKRCISSILSQTYQNFEILLVDDGSTDESVDRARECQDGRIRIIQQDNRGVSAARNRGIREANHDWIAFLDADDEWLPGFLEEIKNLIIHFPNCQVAGTGYFQVKKNGDIQVNKVSLPINPGWSGSLTNYPSSMKKGSPLHSSAFAATKQALLKAGLYPEGVKLSEDLSLFLKIALNNCIAYSYVPLAIYHFEAEERTWKGFDTNELFVIKLGKEILCSADVEREFKCSLYDFLVGLELRRAKALLFQGKKEEVIAILKFCSSSESYQSTVKKIKKWLRIPTFVYRLLYRIKDILRYFINTLDKLDT